MARFVDSAGNEWVLTITAAGIMRVTRAVKLSFGDLQKITTGDADGLEKFGPGELIEAFCALLKPQIDARGITRYDFLEALDVPSMKRAIAALNEAIAGDFPKAEPSETEAGEGNSSDPLPLTGASAS
jgi:hypothetical protein